MARTNEVYDLHRQVHGALVYACHSLSDISSASCDYLNHIGACISCLSYGAWTCLIFGFSSIDICLQANPIPKLLYIETFLAKVCYPCHLFRRLQLFSSPFLLPGLVILSEELSPLGVASDQNDEQEQQESFQ